MSRTRFTEHNLDPALAEMVEAAEGEDVLEGILRLEDPDRLPPHFRAVSRFNRICTGRFPAARAWDIRRHPNVVSLKAARPLGIHQEGVGFDDAELDVENADSPTGFTGRGSIVAALDFGLDFGHPNFLNPDGTTRLLSFWHQGAAYDQQRPNRFGYGRVYSPDEINAALRGPDPYSVLGYHPAISDTGKGSHGTHTLDIAAGNGRARGARPGVAPEAGLIFVHLSTPRLGLVGSLGDSVRLLEALDFVESTASGVPWVANLSLGRTAGSHDGTSLVEQGMHELLRFGPGRAIVQSAGNYRSAHLAVEGWLRDGEQRNLDWIVDPRDTTANELDVWYSGKDRLLVAIKAPRSADFVEVRLGDAADIIHEGLVVGRLYHRRNDPNNRDNHVEVFLYAGAPSGVWTVRLIGDYVISGRFHAWIERDLARPGAQSRFDPRFTSERYTLGTIATSPLVITVGAYDADAEGRPPAHFSSLGPTRDERRGKPELLAPGVEILAARSIPRGASRQEGLLVARSGTSMATPHVSGTVAALYQAAGRPIAIDEIRDCLERSADRMTDDAHREHCAWGRLNHVEAIRKIQGVFKEKTLLASRAHGLSPETSLTSPEAAFSDSATADFATGSEEQDIEVSLGEGVAMDTGSEDRFLAAANRALQMASGGRRQSEVSFLRELLDELRSDLSTTGLSPVDLFKAVLARRVGVTDALDVLALPGVPPEEDLRTGDWMLRAIPGTGDVGHLAVLASGKLHARSALAAEGIDAESTQPGRYAVVMEPGAFPHGRARPFARRLLDSRGRVLPYTLLLRPKYARPAVALRVEQPELERSPLEWPESGPSTSSLNCPAFLATNASTDYFKYIRGVTSGVVSPMINGRSSGGTGSDVDLTEPLDSMQQTVKSLAAGDFVYLAAWFFEPSTVLTGGSYKGETQWGGFLGKKAAEGVKIRMIINDFDAIAPTLFNWLKNHCLDPLNALILSLPSGSRDNFKYIVSLHPAHIGSAKALLVGKGWRNIHIASHHQKFMVVKQEDNLTAFCGGLDIESRKTPARWSYIGLQGWHDIHLKLQGRIAYDLENEFVMRWNRERSSSRRAPLAGWKPHEALRQTPISAVDLAADRAIHRNVQMIRTISTDATWSPYSTQRDDVKEVYRRAIGCATQFIYMENQYFRSTALADWVVAQGKANPGLIVLIVVVADAAADDGKNPLTAHGAYLQHTTLDRMVKGLGPTRVRIYTMHRRAVHSKLLMVDDHFMCVGSANANVRSFELDSELNVSIEEEAVTRTFRWRLWGHNLGVNLSTVSAWKVPDFLAKWDAVANANRLLLAQDMAGEGVIPFDYAKVKGRKVDSLPDALTHIDLAPPNHWFAGELPKGKIPIRPV